MKTVPGVITFESIVAAFSADARSSKSCARPSRAARSRARSFFARSCSASCAARKRRARCWFILARRWPIHRKVDELARRNERDEIVDTGQNPLEDLLLALRLRAAALWVEARMDDAIHIQVEVVARKAACLQAAATATTAIAMIGVVIVVHHVGTALLLRMVALPEARQIVDAARVPRADPAVERRHAHYYAREVPRVAATVEAKSSSACVCFFLCRTSTANAHALPLAHPRSLAKASSVPSSSTETIETFVRLFRSALTHGRLCTDLRS